MSHVTKSSDGFPETFHIRLTCSRQQFVLSEKKSVEMVSVCLYNNLKTHVFIIFCRIA